MSYIQQDVDLSECTSCGNDTGEFHETSDGNLYEWIEGVDGLGNPIGFWKKAKKIVGATAKFASRYTPVLSRVLPPQVAIPLTAAGIGIKMYPVAKHLLAGRYRQAAHKAARTAWEAVPGEARYPTEGVVRVGKHLAARRPRKALTAAAWTAPHVFFPGPAADIRHAYESFRPVF